MFEKIFLKKEGEAEERKISFSEAIEVVDNLSVDSKKRNFLLSNALRTFVLTTAIFANGCIGETEDNDLIIERQKTEERIRKIKRIEEELRWIKKTQNLTGSNLERVARLEDEIFRILLEEEVKEINRKLEK